MRSLSDRQERDARGKRSMHLGLTLIGVAVVITFLGAYLIHDLLLLVVDTDGHPSGGLWVVLALGVLAGCGYLAGGILFIRGMLLRYDG